MHQNDHEFGLWLHTRSLFWSERHLVALEINHTVLPKNSTLAPSSAPRGAEEAQLLLRQASSTFAGTGLAQRDTMKWGFATRDKWASIAAWLCVLNSHRNSPQLGSPICGNGTLMHIALKATVRTERVMEPVEHPQHLSIVCCLPY